MMGIRPFSRLLAGVFLGGMAATIGCGPHPEEGTLKLPPRKGEPRDIIKTEPKKATQTGKKNRSATKETPVGK